MKIPIKKYVDDPGLLAEERLKRLDAHHVEETTWMVGEIKRLEKLLSECTCVRPKSEDS